MIGNSALASPSMRGSPAIARKFSWPKRGKKQRKPCGLGGPGKNFKEDDFLHPETGHDSLLLSPGNALGFQMHSFSEVGPRVLRVRCEGSRMAVVVPTSSKCACFLSCSDHDVQLSGGWGANPGPGLSRTHSVISLQ